MVGTVLFLMSDYELEFSDSDSLLLLLLFDVSDSLLLLVFSCFARFFLLPLLLLLWLLWLLRLLRLFFVFLLLLFLLLFFLFVLPSCCASLVATIAIARSWKSPSILRHSRKRSCRSFSSFSRPDNSCCSTIFT